MQVLLQLLGVSTKLEALTKGGVAGVLAVALIWGATYQRKDFMGMLDAKAVEAKAAADKDSKAAAEKLDMLLARVDRQGLAITRVAETQQQILKKMAGIESKVSARGAPEGGRVAINRILIKER